MPTTTIPWGDGSGDNLYLTYPSASGNQTISVTSDANGGAARSKVVTFSASGVPSVNLTINQAGVPQQHTITLNPSGYIPKSEDGEWYSLVNASNAYNDEENTTYAQLRLTRGEAHALTWCYFTFDTSSIPAGATINSVECKAKVYFNTSKGTRIDNRDVQMFSGTTAKGASQEATTTARVITFNDATWSRNEIDDVRIRFYGVRGTTNLTTDYYFRFYGATLTITYTI